MLLIKNSIHLFFSTRMIFLKPGCETVVWKWARNWGNFEDAKIGLNIPNWHILHMNISDVGFLKKFESCWCCKLIEICFSKLNYVILALSVSSYFPRLQTCTLYVMDMCVFCMDSCLKHFLGFLKQLHFWNCLIGVDMCALITLIISFMKSCIFRNWRKEENCLLHFTSGWMFVNVLWLFQSWLNQGWSCIWNGKYGKLSDDLCWSHPCLSYFYWSCPCHLAPSHTTPTCPPLLPPCPIHLSHCLADQAAAERQSTGFPPVLV